MLQKFAKISKRGRPEWVWNIINGNTTFVYKYGPETKQQSFVWLFPGENPPVKFKRSRSTSKQMIVVFFTDLFHSERGRLPTPRSTSTFAWAKSLRLGVCTI